MRKYYLMLLVIVSLVICLQISATAQTRCVTNGEGYASIEMLPLQKIYDLTTSVSLEDREKLSCVIEMYLKNGLIFIPKAGVVVECAWVPERGTVNVYPVGSTKGYWILKEGLVNCQ